MGELLLVILRFKCCKMLMADERSVGQGGLVSLLPVPVVAMGSIQDLGRRLGITMVFLAVGVVVGPPISGAIYASTGGYKAVGYYAGKRCSMRRGHGRVIIET